MKRIVKAVFSNSKGTVSIVTTRKGKRRGIKFWSASQVRNYCEKNRLRADMMLAE